MAIVKVLFRKNAARVIRYVFRHSQPGDPVDSESCQPNEEGAIDEFKQIRDRHDFQKGNNQALHIIQSWDPNESKTLSAEECNSMGRKLVEQYFKGHQFVIVTHTDTEKTHNHIVVNAVNMDTGRQVEPKYHHLHKLRAINDKICLERGLQIPNKDATLRRANVPQNVQQMVRHGRESWVWDIKNKADVAMFLATSYDQYVGYMDAFGVKARVEDENITYFYPGRSRGKRGDKLGKQYDKPGLEERFRSNDYKFRENPELRERIWAKYSELTANGRRTIRDSGALLLDAGVSKSDAPKDYSHFTKTSRRNPHPVPASERELARSIVPIDEIKRAKRSIPEYCKRNKIELMTNARGQTVLKHRDYVVINEFEATNTKNGTRANLIDFVAAHHKLTLLQAVAKINSNPTLGLVENTFGEVKRKYTSFHVPKQNQMGHREASELLGDFLRANGASHKLADPLLKHQRAEVSTDGIVKLFAESDSGGALEFTQGPGNAWTEQKQGRFQKPFFKRAPRGNQVYVYTEPKSYMARRGANAFSDRTHNDGILALMEPNASHVEHYLDEHKGVQKIHVVSPKGRSMTQAELDFFGVLKSHFEKKGIEVHQVSHEKALSREDRGLSL